MPPPRNASSLCATQNPYHYVTSKKFMRTLLALFLLVAVVEAKSQNAKADNFCQYLDQPIQKLLANLKSPIVDTVVTKTHSGTVRSFLLVFSDSSYFEIFPLVNKTTGAFLSKHINLKTYLDYKIRCLFYHVPGEVVDNCGCRSLIQYRNESLEINYHGPLDILERPPARSSFFVV